ncbi:MAG TPA: hypothetical protein VHV51_09320 [Polyangiaceae bacterium]|jgi:hypothetical protein|nr:hypothetical protein [Polyangiaceae bacterium]
MASESSRTLPPLTPPPPRTSSGSYAQIDVNAMESREAVREARRANSDYPRSPSGIAPADTTRDPDASPAEGFRPGSFAPETAIDEQIADLERWAEANLSRDRKDKLRFWVLRGLAFSAAAAAALCAGLAQVKVTTIAFGVLAALCVAIDSAWPSDSFRNVHRRAVYDLRELQNTLKLRWDKVRLAHPDLAAPQRTAHALALLDQVQSKRDEIGRYLGSAEASPGIKR